LEIYCKQKAFNTNVMKSNAKKKTAITNVFGVVVVVVAF
jgi:hypothetical protein